MSLHPQSSWIVPEQTARVAKAALPKSNPYMHMYDEMGALYSDEMFLALFPCRGRSAESPARLALVLVMQFAGIHLVRDTSYPQSLTAMA